MNTRATWPEKARALAELVPPSRLHGAVVEWARANAQKRGPWLIAFSGGPDSLALLLLLWAHWPQQRRRLRALHFNHRLRGRASGADAAYCRRVCASLGVRCEVGEWQDAPRSPSEGQAREARHAFFAAKFAALHATALWLGHQQDDVAETLLMRVARGSGTGGLAAPRPVQAMSDGRVHLRPLLSLKKAEVIEALKQVRAAWRDDASNQTRDYLRNRMRHDVLLQWSQAVNDRDALGGAALTRELLEEDDTALDQWVRELAPITKRGTLSRHRLTGKPRAVVRRALRLWLNQVAPAARLSRQAFEALLGDFVSGRCTRHSLGATGLAVLDASGLRRKEAPVFQVRVN